MYGEITQDCGRYRHYELGHLDKDVWRAGGSHAQVLDKWRLLAEHIEAKTESPETGLSELYRLEAGRSPMQFVVGTTNQYKLRELAAILRPTGCRRPTSGTTDRDSSRLRARSRARTSSTRPARRTRRSAAPSAC